MEHKCDAADSDGSKSEAEHKAFNIPSGALIRQRLNRADVDRMLELRDGVATRHLVWDTVVLG